MGARRRSVGGSREIFALAGGGRVPMRFVGRIYPPISSVLASLLSREPGRVDRLQITRGGYAAACAGRPLRSLRDLLQDCAAAP
ncbi:hypothetical protein AC233_17550 [Burkholderia sp. HB1]|nr:hypothetical protein AC233_17550 [Burkholderia sp. HB1]